MIGDFQTDRELLEKIGPWTEVKHEIVRKYAAAYSRIMNAQRSPKFHYVYVDAYAGAGRYLSRASGTPVSGSPLIALDLRPPFSEYHFIDLDDLKVARLEELARNRINVTIHHGDCNQLLADRVLPRIRWEDFRRGLCVLDPYGLQLHWSTLMAVAQLQTTEIFLNFPTMDINRNALRKNPESVSPEQANRLTAFWGDASWRDDFYRTRPQLSLFESGVEEKDASNEQVAEAYRRRLRDVAGFKYVPKPLAMRNSTNAIVYYLFFAFHKEVAGGIVEQIFAKYRREV